MELFGLRMQIGDKTGNALFRFFFPFCTFQKKVHLHQNLHQYTLLRMNMQARAAMWI